MSATSIATMDFFGAQEAALRSSRRLVLVFLACASLIAIAVGVVAWLGIQIWEPQRHYAVEVGLWAGGLSLLMILLGSWWKIASISGIGGAGVAIELGGIPLESSTKDPDERRLLNVVEEMAIASGLPAPPVYVIDSPGINAFAAGWDPQHAVLGFTRGAIRGLSRDELQGVVAHEFSHILRGDMRLNMRLIGLLHGLLILAITGTVLMRTLYLSGGRSRTRSRGGRDDGAAIFIAIFMLGLVLYALGSLGALMGRLIQAAVSRQREYMADAAAVQFTRNPGGIAGALKRIVGGSAVLPGAHAAEARHMFFAESLRAFGGMATHPPLAARILRIEPNWNGSVPPPLRPKSEVETSVENQAEVAAMTSQMQPRLQQMAMMGMAAATMAAPAPVVVNATPAADPIGLLQARARLAALPEVLHEAAHDPFDCRALLLLCVLDRDADERRRQAELIAARDPALAQACGRLWPIFRDAGPDMMRPLLLRLATQPLVRMCPEQVQALRNLLRELAELDGTLDLEELAARHAIAAVMDPEPRVDFLAIKALGDDIVTLLAALADSERRSETIASGLQFLRLTGRHRITTDTDGLGLERALQRLERASPHIRTRVLEACMHAAAIDGQLADHEALLLETLSLALRLPLPVAA